MCRSHSQVSWAISFCLQQTKVSTEKWLRKSYVIAVTKFKGPLNDNLEMRGNDL